MALPQPAMKAKKNPIKIKRNFCQRLILNLQFHKTSIRFMIPAHIRRTHTEGEVIIHHPRSLVDSQIPPHFSQRPLGLVAHRVVTVMHPARVEDAWIGGITMDEETVNLPR